jgi:restriction endonuclease XhoI-like protein
VDAATLDQRFTAAIVSFWEARAKSRAHQEERGVIDRGNRSEVTGGTQLGALELLIADLLVEAGLDKLDILTRTLLEIPGYFRSQKKWDLLVVSRAGGVTRLVLAIELKSMAGSEGNNLNNRAEETIGNAVDLWTAFREGRLGPAAPRPFVGFVALVEDRPSVHTPVAIKEAYFKVDPIFKGRSYAERWNILCRRLMAERLYSATCCELINRKAAHRAIGADTSFQAFAAAVEGHALTFRKTIEASP